MPDREPGFYWVRVASRGNAWVICEYRALTGWVPPYGDVCFLLTEIGPCVEPPAIC